MHANKQLVKIPWNKVLPNIAMIIINDYPCILLLSLYKIIISIIIFNGYLMPTLKVYFTEWPNVMETVIHAIISRN